MGLLVLLLDRGPVPAIDPNVATRLAAIGVTSVALLRDDETTAVVVEGWAFDHRRAAREAAATIAPGRTDVRILPPVLQTSLEGPAGATGKKEPHG